MTWRELKNLINKQGRKHEQFLDSEVNLYDFKDGEEYSVDITELLVGEDETTTENDNWVMYLAINHEETTDENKTSKTGIN